MRLKYPATLYAPILLLAVILLSKLSNTLLAFTDVYDNAVFLSVLVVQFVIFLLPCAFYSRIRGIKGVFVPTLMPVRLSALPLFLFGAAVYVFGFLLLLTLGYYNGVTSFQTTISVVSIPSFTDNPILQFACFTCLPAVLDEIVFRAIILHEYAPSGGLISVVTATLFTTFIYSTSLSTLPLLLFMGVLLGGLTYLTKSVLPAVVLRIASNAFILFAEEDFCTYLMQCGHTPLLPYLLAILLCLSLCFFFGRAQALYAGKKEESSLEALQKVNEKTIFRGEQTDRFFSHLRKTVLTPGFLLLASIIILKLFRIL